MIQDRIKSAVRDIPDFPRKGILFKDITPILLDSQLCTDIINEFIQELKGHSIDMIAAIESRGFFFGAALAQKMGLPFIPVRKAGKLPGDVFSYSYDLEYGSSTLEMQRLPLLKGKRILVHDDLLATGGTAMATAELVQKQNATVAAFSFLISLDFLNGQERLTGYSEHVLSLVNY